MAKTLKKQDRYFSSPASTNATHRLALAAYPDLTRRLQRQRCRLGRDRHRRGLAKHIKSPKGK
jgi:hypothetical protein